MSNEKEIRVKLLAHQKEFLKSEEKFCWLAAGLGSGKSFTGSHFIINQVIESPKAKHLICANSYKQLHEGTLSTFFSILNDLGIPFSTNQQRGHVYLLGSTVVYRSLTEFNDLRSIEVGSVWGDESRDWSEEAFNVLIGRQRDKYSKRHLLRLTSTVNGFDWQYNKFVANAIPNSKVIKARSRDNTFLPEGYIDTLVGSYTQEFAQQELDADFVNLTSGKIYYSFRRDKNIKENQKVHGTPIWVGMDFNVNPMTAIFAHASSNGLYVFGEAFIKNSNTPDMAEHIVDKFGRSMVTVVPDSTGRNTSTKVTKGLSDHIILENAGLKVVRSNNPHRVDRYNAVNLLLEKGLLVIDPSCKMLIKDLEELFYKEGTNMPDDSNPMLGHISDALGYLVYKLFGVQRIYRQNNYNISKVG